MGSELPVGALEIDNWQEPRWAAAEDVLAATCDEEVKSAYLLATDNTEAMLAQRCCAFHDVRRDPGGDRCVP
jgi:hypothetical protein